MLDKIIEAVKKAVEIYKSAGEDLDISEKNLKRKSCYKI